MDAFPVNNKIKSQNHLISRGRSHHLSTGCPLFSNLSSVRLETSANDEAPHQRADTNYKHAKEREREKYETQREGENSDQDLF